MLNRVDLTAEQIKELKGALDAGDGRLHTEMATNIVCAVNCFLATRFLPLPRIAAHYTTKGDERDWDIALFKGDEGYVVLQQLRRECGQAIKGPRTIEANLVLHSSLPFMEEQRQDDWPLRVRRLMLEVVQWSVEQGRQIRLTSNHRLWQDFRDPNATQATNDFFGTDFSGLRRVLDGEATVQQIWGAWATNQAAAERELGDCLYMGQVVQNLLPKASPRP